MKHCISALLEKMQVVGFFREVRLDGEIVAVDIFGFSQPSQESASLFAAVATSKIDVMKVTIFQAPDWSSAINVDLDSKVRTTSVLLHTLDEVDYLVVGLGDGTLQYMLFDKVRCTLGPAKHANVGTLPTYLKAFTARGGRAVLVHLFFGKQKAFRAKLGEREWFIFDKYLAR